MDFLPHWIHLFSEFVHEKSCPNWISYGLIVSKRKLDCCPRTTCRDLRMTKLKPLQLMQGKEKEEEILASLIKKNTGKRPTPVHDQKKDMSNTICLNCHDFGHYASQCHQMKKRKSNMHQ